MPPSKALADAENDRLAVKSTINVLEDAWTDQFVNPLTSSGAARYVVMAEKAYLDLIDAHTRIVHAKPADLDPHDAMYRVMMKEIMTVLNQFEGKKIELNAGNPHSSAGTHSTNKVKLPTLSLPTFDGSLIEWVQFRDMFMSTVDQNTSLSPAQKLAHLKTVVVGEPAGLIKTLLLTDGNYKIAWDTLQARYQNEKDIIFAIFKKFLAQPAISNQSSKSIRSLLDVSSECVRSLEAQKILVHDGLESFFVYFLLTKLDQQSREFYEQTLKDSKVPSLKSLQDFLEQRSRSLTAGEDMKQEFVLESTKDKYQSLLKRDSIRKTSHTHHTADTRPCPMSCPDVHQLYRCRRFSSKSIEERQDVVKKSKLCFNCLHTGHSSNACPSQSRCKVCKGKHHSSICTQQQSAQQPPAVVNHSHPDGSSQTMLATALVRVVDGNGQEQLCRAMLDGGSTSSFVTQACVQRLRLPQQRNDIQVVGLSSTHVGSCKGSTSLTFSPHFTASTSFVVNALVLPRITGQLPYYKCNSNSLTHLQGLRLADPQFNQTSAIDLLLGSDIFWNLLLDGKMSGPPGTPVGINSHLGWLVAGQTTTEAHTVHTYHIETSLDAQLQRFWELESMPTSQIYTPEEQQAEDHFLTTHSRDSNGKYTVQLPKKPEIKDLGDSRSMALRRFKGMESRLQKAPHHYDDYRKFMAEILSLGHMEAVPEDEVLHPKHSTYYIPHHFVLKADSTTTKFRVVFDASAKTTTGKSLNDCLLVGPVIQDNLTDIITRFRCHQIGFTADIAKMYRQIRVTNEDADLQRIFWRDNPSQPVTEYRLTTVTYGVACAPFLATRILQHLALSAKQSVPTASRIAIEDFYVDDLLSGSDNTANAIRTSSELNSLLDSGGFSLRKYESNSRELIHSLPEELRGSRFRTAFSTTTSRGEDQGSTEDCITSLSGLTDNSIKCLGILWNISKDQFEFQVSSSVSLNTDASVLNSTNTSTSTSSGISVLPSTIRNNQYLSSALSLPPTLYTKRAILSETAKLFDPLGWLSPIVISAKILMQDLWKFDLPWDLPVPLAVQQKWVNFKQDLQSLHKLKIPRCILKPSYSEVHLAGFSDASEKAYSAVVYLCVYYRNSPPLISLIASKTRVAPTKQISLPRLELCGAVLLSQLIVRTKKVLHLDVTRARGWTDSTIVLGWIQTPSCRLKTFVGNRVSEIQANVPATDWYHVPGTNNPADCASRGISTEDLINHPLWWHGPSFLKDPPNQEVNQDYSTSDTDKAVIVSELRPSVIAATASIEQPHILHSLLQRFSSFRTLVRVIAWVRRYLKIKYLPKQPTQRGPLLKEELDDAQHVMIRFVQQQAFQDDLCYLRNNKSLPTKSKLLPLSPFLDTDGLLRVGGRLRHSSFPYSRKHPILLPRHSSFTDLLIRSKHLELFHAGPTLVQAVLQQSYWIIRAKDAIRFHTRKCITCRRHAADTMKTKMGDLPSSRVTAGRAFLNVGVDYAGPFLIKSDAPRSKYQSKGYLCIFVCMATRAVHLELATSLSTEAFMAALKRFVS